MDLGKKKTRLVTLLIPFAGLLLFWSVFWPKQTIAPPFSEPVFIPEASLTFDSGKKITIEVADTDEKRSQGLSYRSNLPADSGLYFTFPQEDQYVFWMKDMLFPIDILWIGGGQILKIDHAPLESIDPPVERYLAPVPLDRVLEIPAGKSEEWGIKVGDRVFEEFE